MPHNWHNRPERAKLFPKSKPGAESTMLLDQITVSRYDHVTAVEVSDRGDATLFFRHADGVEKQNIPYRPFILLTDPALLEGFAGEWQDYPLNGNARLACLVDFADVPTWEKALKHLKVKTGFSASAPGAPFLTVSDLSQQLLMKEQIRLFRGLEFAAVRRLQFDIETLTAPGFEFPNPERETDRIIIITMSDNTGWEKVISGAELSEKQLLEEFVRQIAERDPDIIEGHNICRFDLPYIETRAKLHKVKLLLGRDKQPLKKRPSQFSAAERIISYTRYDAWGRHIVDTYHLALFYDITHRNLESYGLKYIARHFGVAAPERTYIEGSQISAAWENDRERLLAYALDDVRETRAIANILAPSYFYQTQLIPMKYQDCLIRGNATRINALLLAEYLNASQSIPCPEPAVAFSGALTQAFAAGVFENIWHCDVRSLYPSIILAEKWDPQRDELGIFSRLLGKLREFRLAAKDAERKAPTPAQKDELNALQTTFKILINSFYGYLGFSQGNFNDFGMAENVTARGREILTLMLDFLRGSGAQVIEMDTDGIYFQPPAGITDPADMEARVQAQLPPGIEVELDSTYPAMFCYKSKNYALLDRDGEITVTGAALKSRGLEPFQRDYIHELLKLVLTGHADQVEKMTQTYRDQLQNHQLPLDKLAKTETLSDSLDTYRKKLTDGKGRRSAAYELAGASGRDYRRGDQVSFYITGEKAKVSVVDNSRLLADAPPERDENIKYYLAKLEELHEKFLECLAAQPESAPSTDSFELEAE